MANRPPGRPVRGRGIDGGRWGFPFSRVDRDKDKAVGKHRPMKRVPLAPRTMSTLLLASQVGVVIGHQRPVNRIRDRRVVHPCRLQHRGHGIGPHQARDLGLDGLPSSPICVRSIYSGRGRAHLGGSNILVHIPSEPITDWRGMVIFGFW